MKGKSKIIKGILIIFLIALIGAGVYAIASQKWKIGNTKNSETTRDEKEDEIGNEENIKEQEPPIDNYVEKLSKINCKGVAKEKGGFAINGVKLGMTKEEVERFIKYKPVEISIYNEISDKSDDMIIDKIEDTSDSIEDVVAKRYLKSNLINMLKRAKLDDREIEVLILRFGLCGCESQSCEKLSKLYGLTKQRLNQIELTALKKVRLSGVAMELIEFAEDYEEAKNKIKE